MGKLKIMLLDVTAAFLYGDCERPLFMELPQEDPRSSNPNLVCEADQVSVRDARRPAALGKACREELRGLGYAETKGAPFVYYHKEKDVEITLHIDDFLVVGEEEHRPWRKSTSSKERFLAQTKMTARRAPIWRILQWCDWGIEMEGNPKHIQELLKTTGMESSKSVNTQLTAEDCKDDDSKKTDFQRRELTVAEAMLYRRGTALCVYISQDCGDISAATCQLATRMATPTVYT